jgi:hypothetical protein
MAKEKKDGAAEQEVPQLEKISFHAAILTHDGTYFTESFETLPALVARLKELVDKDVSVFTFAGARLLTSKPPFRHLITPWGNHALFDVPESLEPDDTGYLGVDPIGLGSPAELKAPGASRAAHTHDDLFADDGGGVMNVFDSVLPDPDAS